MVNLKKWLVAMRAWSLTAAIIPVAAGSAYAALEVNFNWNLFWLTQIASIAVQAGTNFINTYGDYVSGVDHQGSARGGLELVQGTMSLSTMYRAGLFSFGLAGLIGLYLTFKCGWPVFAFGLIGVLFGYGYTAGLMPYKYLGLGLPVVFVLMGPLMTMPAFYIQSGYVNFGSFLISIPIACLVTNILLANELRDIECDKKSGITTLSIALGFTKARLLYAWLCILSYISLFLLVIFKIVPVGALLPILLLPLQYKILRDLFAKENNIKTLVRLSGKWHLLFGVLYVLGLLAF